jgi:hypothetical protein
MKEAAADVEGKETQKPQNEENDCKRHQHGGTS